jgi:hypothetical protein
MGVFKHYIWLLFGLFILSSCKANEIAVIAEEKDPVVIAPQEETLESTLTKRTALIKRVVLFKETILKEGINEIYLEYLNHDNLPMVLMFFKIDLKDKNIALKPLTPNGNTIYAMQSIPDMIKTNSFPGYHIVGAVNSDFFNTSTGEPRSVLIVNGNAVREVLPAIRSYFGITKDGKPVIGDATVYAQQKESIIDALGGYHRLIKNSLPVNQTDVSIHPRTAVGFTANQTVYFLVADGRNATYSNGLTLAQVAEIMKALDVKECINLDGGGSSTFVTNINGLIVKNKPSDGKPRAVANGWAICVKD